MRISGFPSLTVFCAVSWSCVLLMFFVPGTAKAQLAEYPPFPVFTVAKESNCVAPAIGYKNYVAAMLRQPDGGVIYAGRFGGASTWEESPVDGKPTMQMVQGNGIVRMKPDGSFDVNWHPDIRCDDATLAASVTALATDSHGNVYAGGLFVTGSDGKRNLARFNAKGELDTAWRVDVDGEVLALTVDENDNVYVGGRFRKIGEADRPYLAKISQGKIVRDWKPAVDASVRALLLDAAGNVYVGGGCFSDDDSYDYRNCTKALLAKFRRDGEGLADPDWRVDVAGALVAALAMDGQGRLYAGGMFRSVNGFSRHSIVRLDGATGAVDPQWMAAADEGFLPTSEGVYFLKPTDWPPVLAIAVADGGEVFVGGSWYSFTGGFGTLAKIDAQGKRDQDWGKNLISANVACALLIEGAWLRMGGMLMNMDGSFLRVGDEYVEIYDGFYLTILRPTSSMNINQRGIGGSWYNPETSGQGLLLHVYPDMIAKDTGLLTGTWYTFSSAEETPADASGQRWYTIEGRVYPYSSISPFTEVTLYETSGGRFDAAPTVSGVPVGHGILIFGDCNTGSLSYRFDDGRTGTVPLARLTANVTCAVTGDNGQPPSSSLLSGPWYDPDTSGQGLMVDANPVNALLAAGWFTYARDGSGEQRWYTLEGPLAPGAKSVDVSIVATTGGKFDAPDPVERSIVGKAQVTFESCALMTVDYVFDDGLNGSMRLQPVGPVPAGCTL